MLSTCYIYAFDYNFVVNDNELESIFREAQTQRRNTSLQVVRISKNILYQYLIQVFQFLSVYTVHFIHIRQETYMKLFSIQEIWF